MGTGETIQRPISLHALSGGPGCVPRPCSSTRAAPVCRDMPFVIRRDGTWLYQGSPICRKALVCLFSGVLTRDAEGAFVLETPVECGRIVVEDAPFVAVELDWGICHGIQHLSFRLNIDQVVCAGPAHPIRVAFDPASGDPVPYVMVRPGKGAHPVEARIGRAVYYELVALAVPHRVEERDCLGVWSGGQFFPLGDEPREAG